ncbi:MAG: cytochrome P450 [Nostoc sp. LLA-1]|nr:cytochrome P450 [Cyanocohniella sp. LLY]
MQLPNRLKAPRFIQNFQWVVDPIGYMENAAKKYPDIFTAEIVGFGNTVTFVNNPQAIQEILTEKRKKFASVAELNRFVQPVLGDYSLLMLDGDRHKKRRQLLMPSLHGERMRAYGELISHLTEKIFSQIPVDQTFSARRPLQEISFQVILQVIFGLHEGERYQQLTYLLVSILNVFRSPLTAGFLLVPSLQKDLGPWSPWGKFVRQRQQINELLQAEITERRAQLDPDRIDILSLLMLAKDENGQGMSDEELCDELKTLMFGGYETTSTVMSWGLYWIHHHPEIRKKLLQELDSLGDSPDPMSIFRLPYFTAVCNETLRIHPVVMMTFPTVVQEPVELLGYAFEPGMALVGCIYLTHQREDLYPQPKEFRPERFLERQFSLYEFMPFGGVRRCIGEALAMYEMKLVFAKILSNYQLELADRQPERPERQALTIAPANGVKMVMTGRRARPESPVNMATAHTA